MTNDTLTPIVSSPTGAFDHSACAALEQTIKELALENNTHHIIDLRAVTKVDARTIRTMFKINRNLSEIGGSIRLVIENPKALRYIKLTALERVLRVYPTPDAALAGYASDDRCEAQTDTQTTEGLPHLEVSE
jgi:anti-anti-sigma factor